MEAHSGNLEKKSSVSHVRICIKIRKLMLILFADDHSLLINF